MHHISRRALLCSAPIFFGTSFLGTCQATPVAESATTSNKPPLDAFVTPQMFGALGDGITDDTVAMQAALNFSRRVYFLPGVYLLSRTLRAQQDTVLIGAGPELTKLYRVANYGDTFVCGENDGKMGAGGFTCRGIWFQHGAAYSPGQVALSHPVSAGAHIRLYGPQQPRIEDCYFWRMPYGIAIHGGSIIYIMRNTFIQVNDPTASPLQEGLAGVTLDCTSSWGNTKDAFFNGNEFLGQKSASRTVSIKDANGNKRTVTIAQNIGPTQHIHANGCETLHIAENYFGCSSNACINLNPTSEGYLANVRIINNFLDGSGITHIMAQVARGGRPIEHLSIIGNQINGELNTPHGITILAQGMSPSVYDLIISENSITATYGSGIIITGSVNQSIRNNIIFGYNCLGVSPATTPYDGRFSAAIYIGGNPATERFGLIEGNQIGGGINVIGTAINYCWLGIYKEQRDVSVRVGANTYMGVGSPATYGQSSEEVVTVTKGSYNCSGFENVILCNNSSPLTINLNLSSPSGEEIVIKDIADAATNNIIIISVGGRIEGKVRYIISQKHASVRLISSGNGIWQSIN